MKVIKIVIAAYLITSCNFDKIDDRDVIIVNRSNKSIHCIISSNDSIKTIDHYNGFPNGNTLYSFKDIKPNTVSEPNDRPRAWSTLFNRSDGNKIRLFILEKDLIDKYGWEKVLEKNIYSRKYKLSVEGLDSIKWRIEYMSR